MVKLSQKDLNRININQDSNKEKKQKTPMDRFYSIIDFNQNDTLDTINVTKDKVIINIKNIKLLSNNDMLRIDNRKLTRYKNQCKDRIKNLVNKIDINEWQNNSKNKKIKLEYIYAPSHGKKMDTIDGISGAFKYLIDGLTLSNLIIDDSDEYLPVAISKQFKGSNEIFILLTLIDNIDNYYSPEFKRLFDKI